MATLPPPITTTRSPRRHAVAEVGVQQEVDAVDHAVEIAPGMFSSRPRDGAEREEHGRVAVAAQVADGEVAPEPPLELQLDAERQDLIDLGADQVARQAVLGHALVQHAARRRAPRRRA